MLAKSLKGKAQRPETAEAIHPPNEPVMVPVSTSAVGRRGRNQQLELPKDGKVRAEMARLEMSTRRCRRAWLRQLEEPDVSELELKQRLGALQPCLTSLLLHPATPSPKYTAVG